MFSQLRVKSHHPRRYRVLIALCLSVSRKQVTLLGPELTQITPVGNWTCAVCL